MTISTNPATVIIPLNKMKLTLMFAGSLAFVAIGIWFISSPEIFYRYGTLKVTAVGYSAIIFFGICAAAILIKLFNKRPGLIIDEAGITDNSSALSAGLIPWSDITGITTSQISRQRFIIVNVGNPDDYINRQSNAFKRKIAQINSSSYGSPINISTNGLKYNFDDLYNLLIGRLSQFEQNTINKNS